MERPNEQRPSFAQRIVAAAFQNIVRLWPAASGNWAIAMQAELTAITETNESLLWLMGGLMSLIRAWWNQILFGTGDEASAVSKRVAATTAAVLLIIAMLFLVLPGMPQGFLAVVDAWRTEDAGQSVSALEKLGAEAERVQDANLLAFVALHLPDSPDKTRWADRAVSLDPKLTWIYFQMQSYGGIAPLVDPSFDRHVSQLQAWDPANAVPFLMQADRVLASEGALGTTSAYEARLGQNAAWLNAMDKAFRADHFDDYALRRFELDRLIQEQHRQSRPMNLALSLFASQIPNLMDVRIYADWLLHQGDRLRASGDAAGATACYWRVAVFAQRMGLDSHDATIERLIALAIAEPSFEKLRDISNDNGKVDEADYASYEIANIHSDLAAIRQRHLAEPEQSAVWSALMLHISALLILVTAFLSAISASWLLLSAARTQAKLSVTNWALAISRYSAAALVCAGVVFYTHYIPVLQALQSASTANPETLSDFARTFQGLLYVPSTVSNSWVRGGSIYFWAGVVALCSCSGLVVIARMAWHTRLAKNAA